VPEVDIADIATNAAVHDECLTPCAFERIISCVSDGRASRYREEDAMISLHDCLGLCGLSEVEVLALAEHEHIPEIVATALAQHLLCQSDGCRRIGAMIADDVNWATERGDQEHAEELRKTLRHFVKTHPKAMTSLRARACLKGGAQSVV
jgi:hypothetical protein